MPPWALHAHEADFESSGKCSAPNLFTPRLERLRTRKISAYASIGSLSEGNQTHYPELNREYTGVFVGPVKEKFSRHLILHGHSPREENLPVSCIMRLPLILKRTR